MENMRFQDLVSKTETIVLEALAPDTKNRTHDEKMFFCAHGFWPEAAVVAERIESCFTTHGLKTTIILEREPINTCR
jgi:hypothetical protein